ncbi:MAG: hypothetical protein ACYCYF_09395, partial [Anaerolineae bacterium]
ASLNGLANWADVQQHLLQLIHEHRAVEEGRPVAGVAGLTPAGSEATALLSDILAEVRQLRAERR